MSQAKVPPGAFTTALPADSAVPPGAFTAAPPATTTGGGFQQRLGLFDVIMLVAGSMIGSGIFIVSSEIASQVGSSGWLLFIWVLTGVLTIIGALCYAELSSMMPNAGGQYVYLREAYGSLAAFLYGWTFFMVIQTGLIAAVGVAFTKFLGVFVEKLGAAYYPYDNGYVSSGQLVAVVLVIVLTFLNNYGVELGRWVQNIFTVTKTAGLILLIVLGLTIAANPEAIKSNTTDIWGGITQTASYAEVEQFAPWQPLAMVLVLCGAMVGSLFAADAWNNVTFIASEVKDARRTLPWGLVLGASVVMLLYLLANVAYLAALPLKGKKADDTVPNAAFVRGIDHAKEGRVGTAVLEEASPRLGVPLMAALIMVSTFGCNNGLILMGARLYYAMARDGLFFKRVGKLNRWGVPGAGLWLQCAWTIVLIFSGSYNQLLDYIVFAALMFYILTVGAVFILRFKQPDAPRPYRTWGYPIVPALYILVCTVIMVSLLIVKPEFVWRAFIIVLAGIPVYFLWRSINKNTTAATAS